ncbi:MAG: TetR/AcrR family transcriptional regulator [Labilithrix sp.]|nr:TetR/AcrR family transcriptional regulator [Labilithrix sp.]MBX3224771.1 TetR/AcrR family transcriptional regulator [Labilithrix sp.]
MRPSSKPGSATTARSTRRRAAPKGPPPPRRGKPSAGKDESRARVRLDVDERRAQLVELGLAEFGTRTYEEVSIDLIAQAAGISKGLLYHYFPTKRAYYVACVREAAARLLARMDVPPEVPPLERLQVGLDRYLEYVRGHGGAFATLMRSGAFADRELAAVVDETRATLLGRLTSGMADIFPAPGMLSSPLLPIALQGWVGLAEATSIAWVEACVASEKAPASAPAPRAADVRDLLAQALIALVHNALR